MSKPFTNRWGLIVGCAAVIAVGAFVYLKFGTASKEKEFSLIKPWFEPQGAGEVLSEGFFWVHRQCHENLVDTDPEGSMAKRSASEVNRIGERTWKFRISNAAKWSDDGKVVTADDFVNAFNARTGRIKAPEFLRIKKVSAEKSTSSDILNNDLLTVELNGAEDQTLDMATLRSPWLTPLKLKKDSEWSWAKELSGPCDGPFVPNQAKVEFILTRNKYWREFKPEYISVVKVKLDNNSVAKTDNQLELFRKGALSFVGPGTSQTSPEIRRAVYGRAFLEPKAYYILINPRGTLGVGSLSSMPHFAINRGELVGVSNAIDKLFAMFRVLPLSLMSRDSAGQPVRLPPINLESVLDARHALGIKDDTLPIDKIVPPFKKELKILANADTRMEPVVERFAARLKANYNINSQVEDYETLDKLPANWDVLFVSISTADGVYGWARDLSHAITKAIPSRPDLAAKIASIAKDKSEIRISPKAVATALEVDALAPNKTVILPLGQFGYEILIEDGVIDVAVSGEGRLDPDVSRARRLVINKSQDKKL
jgi:hypothetical protein